MSDEKLTPSLLYTTEAKESKKKTEEELAMPDPDSATAEQIINENLCDEDQGEEKE